MHQSPQRQCAGARGSPPRRWLPGSLPSKPSRSVPCSVPSHPPPEGPGGQTAPAAGLLARGSRPWPAFPGEMSPSGIPGPARRSQLRGQPRMKVPKNSRRVPFQSLAGTIARTVLASEPSASTRVPPSPAARATRSVTGARFRLGQRGRFRGVVRIDQPELAAPDTRTVVVQTGALIPAASGFFRSA